MNVNPFHLFDLLLIGFLLGLLYERYRKKK